MYINCNHVHFVDYKLYMSMEVLCIYILFIYKLNNELVIHLMISLNLTILIIFASYRYNCFIGTIVKSHLLKVFTKIYNKHNIL